MTGSKRGKKKKSKTPVAAKTDDNDWKPNLDNLSGDEKKPKRKKKNPLLTK